MTTTNEDLRHALTRLTRAMESADLDTSHLYIQQGSKTYGRAYRLFMRDPDTGGLSALSGFTGGYLGMTKREAVESLDMLATGIRLVGFEAKA